MMSRWWRGLLVTALIGGCWACDDAPLDAPLDGAVDVEPLPEPAPEPTPDPEPEGEPPPDNPAWTPAPAPAVEVPPALAGDTWRAHFVDDILPYWTQDAALGEPIGNFPTYRDMDGAPRGPNERRPRMLGRQIYTYAMGYALTGDPALLRHARAGIDWLLAHAPDRERGGWFPVLMADGTPTSGAKSAQDTAYAVMGLAAYYFVTRDPAIEAELLATRDLLFDPAAYFDAENARIRDAVTADLSRAFDLESDGGWELVAQLDPINAFMLLVQPVLTEADRRDQLLADMQTLADTMIGAFWADGVFWGVHNRQGQYGTRHVDFGHTLKSYWMVFQIDKRLPGAPYRPFLEEHAPGWIDRAFDAENGRWAKRPTGPASVEYGSDWWIYAEADQIAAAFNMVDPAGTERLAATAGHWLTDYVDPVAGEVIPGVDRAGQPVFGWRRTDTAKCNQWKNGYHATEHAVILYLHGRDLEGLPATLHFAVTPETADDFPARPYLFEGTEVERRPGDTFEVGDATLQAVAVDFVDIY